MLKARESIERQIGLYVERNFRPTILCGTARSGEAGLLLFLPGRRNPLR
jgi:hypothetical protein